MNSVYVWGTPDGEGFEEKRVDLTKQIISIFDYLRLGDVVVFFPPEQMKWDLGKEIMVYISGPDLPKEGEYRDFLAASVGRKVCSVFSPEYIDVMVLDEPKEGEGRWSWSKKSIIPIIP